jgi:predicted acylesterase/phospholipase RssA
VIQQVEFVYALGERRPLAALSGASAGALAILAYALGLSLERVQNQLEGACSRNRLISGGPHNLLFHGAWTDGAELRRNIGLLIDKDTILRDVRIPVAVSVGDRWTRRPVVVTSWNYPTVNVLDLACQTAAIPRVFPAKTIRGIGNEHTYVDGGTANNLPASSLDRFGLPVISASFNNPSTSKKPNGFIDECLADLDLVMYASSNAWVSKYPKSRVVQVEAANGFDFNLSRQECLRRRALGRYAAENAVLP